MVLPTSDTRGVVCRWAGKLVGAVGRIAGCLHMAQHAGTSDPWEIPVAFETVEHAIQIGRYLIPHAKAAFALMGADPAVEQAKRTLRWIRHRQLTSVSKRDLHQGMRGTFQRIEELEKPLELLVNHGFIRPQGGQSPEGPGRPRSPVYEVNPNWIRQVSETPGRAEF